MSLIPVYVPVFCRRRGCLVSGPVIENPEGLAIARQACFVASAGNAAVIAVVLQGSSRGTILQQLALAEDAVPWGMAVWDPSTYPLHALAAREAYTPRHTTKEHGYKPSSDVQPQHAQAAVASAPNGAESNAVPTDQGAPHQPSNATAISGHAAATCDGGIAGGSCSVDGAEGCLLVAIQADAEKKSWWLPPAGPPSGSLVCIPLGEGAQMLGWREWSKVKIKRPSGVTIDHAGVSVQLTGSSVCWGGSPLLSSCTACRAVVPHADQKLLLPFKAACLGAVGGGFVLST